MGTSPLTAIWPVLGMGTLALTQTVVQVNIESLDSLKCLRLPSHWSADLSNKVQRQKLKVHQLIDDAGLIPGQTQCTQGACLCQQDQDGALPAAEPG